MSEDFKLRILREQIRLALEQVPTMQGTSLIVALVLCYTIRHIVPYASIITWLALILLIVSGRIVLYRKFSKVRQDPFAGESWKNAYLILALASGVIWGLSAFIIFPASNPVLISVFVLVMASLSAATTISHSSIRLASTAWVGPVMLSYAIRCTMEGGEYGYSVAFLIMLYLFTILRYSFKHYRFIDYAISLRFENLKLLEEVQRVNDSLCQEIAERKLAQEALQGSEEKFRLAFQTSPDSINLNRASDGMYLDVNDGFTAIMGYTRDEVIGKTCHELNIWHDLEDRDRMVASLGSTGFVENLEAKFRGKDDMIITGLLSARILRINHEKIILNMTRDITERKRVEEQRRQTEQTLWKLHELQRVLLSAIPAYAYIKDTNSVYMIGNKRFSELSGVPEYEIPGKTDYDFFSERDADCFRKDDKEIITTGRPRLNYEMMGTDAEANTIWYSTSKCPFYGPSGEIAGLVGICIDITDRKRAEEERERDEKALRKSEEHYRSLFENMLDGFAYCKMIFENERPVDFEFLVVNGVFEELTGLKNVVGKKVTEVIPGIGESNPETFEIFGRVAVTGRPERFETYLSGLYAWFIFSVYSHEPGSFVTICDDISDRKRAEAALKFANEKLEKRVDERTCELMTKTINLEEVNTALKVLLDRREEDRKEFEQAIADNLKSLILPYIEKLQRTRLSSDQATYLSILESHLAEIESRFVKKLSMQHMGLTPTEMQVAVLIRDGKETKDIAEILHVSVKAVEFHRNNIRRKLNIRNKKENLRSHLISLS